jgi:hypothetical protein
MVFFEILYSRQCKQAGIIANLAQFPPEQIRHLTYMQR